MNRRRLAGTLAAALALALPGAALADGPAAYQIDAAHSGFAAGTTFAPPLGKRWVRRDIGGEGSLSAPSVSYPVMAEGKIFLSGGGSVYALDRNGNTVWSRAAASNGLAYDDGRVFLVDSQGVMQALSAADGSLLWNHEIGFDRLPPAPTAYGEFVYAATNERVYGVRQADGIEVWSESGAASEGSIPAVDEDRTYSSDGCAETTAFQRTVGVKLWTHPGGCTSGGPGTAPVVHGGLVYAHSSFGGVVLDPLTGSLRDTFTATTAPAFEGGVGYFVNRAQVYARDLASGVVRWRYDYTDPSGSEPSLSAPIIAGSHLYFSTTSGRVVALARDSGQEVWRNDLRATISSSYGSNYARPGLAAAGDMLVVSVGDRVVAFSPGPDTPGVNDPDKPPPTTDTLSLERTPKQAVYGGDPVTLAGETYDRGRVEILADRWPFDEAYKRIARVRADRFGGYRLRVRPTRNTRYRAVFNGTYPPAQTRSLTVYLNIAYRFKLEARTRRSILVRLGASAPPAAHLRGSRYFVYHFRRGARSSRRVGSMKMRGSRTHVRAQRVVRTPVLRRTDRLFACRRERRDDGFGRYFPEQARCGAKFLR